MSRSGKRSIPIITYKRPKSNFAHSISNFGKGNWKAGATQMAVAGAQAMDAALVGDKNFGA
jgi:hypothetical protein